MKLPTLLVRALILVFCRTVQSQFTPLAPIVSRSLVDCTNSWLWFKTKHPITNEIFNHVDCLWVAKKVRKRCKFENVSAHCPFTCNTCETCADSKAEFFYKKNYETCEIADTKTCDNKALLNTCKATCGTCVSSSASPTTSLNASPTASPSRIHVCVNSWLKFNTRNPTTNEVFENINCVWASKKDERCDFDNVSSHCPETCDTCETCIDSKAEFIFRKELATCDIANEDSCDINGVSSTCRATCGTC